MQAPPTNERTAICTVATIHPSPTSTVAWTPAFAGMTKRARGRDALAGLTSLPPDPAGLGQNHVRGGGSSLRADGMERTIARSPRHVNRPVSGSKRQA